MGTWESSLRVNGVGFFRVTLDGKSEEGFSFADARYSANLVDDFGFKGFKRLSFDDGGEVPRAENAADVFDAVNFFKVAFDDL